MSMSSSQARSPAASTAAAATGADEAGDVNANAAQGFGVMAADTVGWAAAATTTAARGSGDWKNWCVLSFGGTTASAS